MTENKIYLKIIFVFLLFFIFASTTNAEIYKKALLFKGKIGDGVDELKYIKRKGEPTIGPWTFAVKSTQLISIYDPNSNAIKRFSFDGKFIGTTKLESRIVIDDMLILDDNSIVCRTWDNHLLHILCGNILRKAKLPLGGDSSSSLYNYNDDIYLYHDYENKGMVGLRYKLDFELVETKKDRYNLWVETGGNYYTELEEYKEKDILRSDGSRLIKDPDPNNFVLKSLGVDRKKNLYLIYDIKQKDGNIKSVVRKYNKTGKRIAEFTILPYYYLPESHLIKLDRNGNVYLLYVSDDWSSWEMYRYEFEKEE